MLQPATSRGTACARSLPGDAIPPHVRRHLLEGARRGPVGGYVYDVAAATRRARTLRAALPEWADLLFALKANSFEPVVRALAADGGVDGLEVASAAEARLARTVMPAGVVATAGPAKHPALLDQFLEHDVDIVHAESELELRRLSAAAARAGRRVAVALRVNPERVAVAGSLAMAGRASAFGFPEPAVPAAIDLVRRLPHLDLVGFHVHAVCGNRDARAHAAYVAWCLQWATGQALAHGLDLRWLDVGGGLGVSYDGVDPLDLGVLAAELDLLRPPSGVRVALEPGRWLAADCGWYAAEVVDVKESYGETFVVVRGGIGAFALPGTEDFPLPVAVLPVEELREDEPRAEAREVAVTVAGELCTPEDVLARDVVVPHVRSGDLVVVPGAGAYGWEFALHAFLGHPLPTREVVAPTAETAETAPPSRSSTPLPNPRSLEATP